MNELTNQERLEVLGWLFAAFFALLAVLAGAAAVVSLFDEEPKQTMVMCQPVRDTNQFVCDIHERK